MFSQRNHPYCDLLHFSNYKYTNLFLDREIGGSYFFAYF